MVQLLLIELMFNRTLHLLKVPCQIILAGCFFICSFASLAQEKEMKLLPPQIIKVANEFISAGQYEKFNITIDTVNHLLYSHIGTNSETNELYFLRYNTINQQNQVLRVLLKDKIDYRYGLFRIGINYPKNKLFVVIGKSMLEIDPNTLKTKTSKIEETQYAFCDGEISYLGKYERYNGRFEAAKLQKYQGGKLKQTLDFSMEDVAMTAFSNNKLILDTKNFIFWCHVSRPVIYRYDHDLKLVDSLVFDTNWTLPAELKTLPENKLLYKHDIYSFYMKGIEKSFHVNAAIHLLNDSTVFISTINQMDSVNYYFVHFNDKGNMVRDQMTIRSSYEKCDEMNDCHFLGQESYGTICNNELFYLKRGKAMFPWDSDDGNPDYSKFTYFHLYTFKIE